MSLLNNRFFLSGLIAAFTFVIFLPSVNNEFITLDDPAYVLENDLIKELSVESIREIFTTPVVGNYHPLTILTYALEYAVFGSKPFIYHLDNLLLHILNTFLVFWFIFGISKNAIVAGITSLLFGIHPMHVESVAWVSERKDLLYACFYLAALVFYTRYTQIKKTKFLICALIFFLFSLLSKAMAVTLPLVFFLIDYLQKRNISGRSFLEKVPFLLLSITFGIVAIFAQRTAVSIGSDINHSILDKLIFASHSLSIYIVKAFAPYKLASFYAYPIKSDGFYPMIYYISPVIILCFGALVFWSKKLGREIIFGSLFMLVTIILVLQILPVGAAQMAERYTYLPYIGIFFITGFVLNYFRLMITHHTSFRLIYYISLISLSVFVIYLSATTWNRTQVWKNSLVFWTDLVVKYPDQPGAYDARGIEYYKAGNLTAAITDFDRALELHPGYWESYINRGLIRYENGEIELALADMLETLRYNPSSSRAYFYIGSIHYTKGDFLQCLQDFSNCIQYNSTFAVAYYNRSLTYEALRQWSNAYQDAEKAKSLGYPVEASYLQDLRNNLN